MDEERGAELLRRCVYYPVAPVLPFLRIAVAQAGSVLHLAQSWGEEKNTLRRVVTGKQQNICCHTADRWTVRLGFVHPAEVWGMEFYLTLMATTRTRARITPL